MDLINRMIRFIGKVKSEEMCGLIQTYVTYFPHTMYIYNLFKQYDLKYIIFILDNVTLLKY